MNSRRFLHKAVNSLMIVLTVVWPIVQPMQLKAADFYWDADTDASNNFVNGNGTGGTGSWTTAASNWWSAGSGSDTTWANGGTDRAIFSGNDTQGPQAVTVDPGIFASGLSFNRGGYTLTGGDVFLGGASLIDVTFGDTATINTQVLGITGLNKMGGGAVRLGAGNAYTGTTTISGGSVIINNQSALGTDPSAIVVTGNATRGFGGGSLVLDGSAGAVTISRNISLLGLGPISDRSAALIGVRDNTISGLISANQGAVTPNTRITSAGGRLSLTGGLDVGGTALATFTTLGGAANTAGSGSYSITGPLTGTGILEKNGSGTLILAPSDTSGFSGSLRLSSSATGTSSSVRIASPGVLGTRTATGTGSVLDLNGGTLEVRMDTPSVLSGGSAANVYLRASTTVFADHAIGSSAINGDVNLGSLLFEDNQNFTFNGRNGYGVNFGGSATVNGGDNPSTFANNLVGGGELTFAGATFWGNTDNGAQRNLSFVGNGNTRINGNLTASAASFNHAIIKDGTGTLTLLGTAATLDGVVAVRGGVLEVNDFRAINNNAVVANTSLQLGTGGTGATLLVSGNNLSLANLTLARNLTLLGTTGGGTVLASQTGTSPGVVINSMSFSGGNATQAKTLTLGGTNTGNNTINAIIRNNDAGGTVSLLKQNAGTWLLAGNNTYTGPTTVQAGTLRVQGTAAGGSNKIVDTGAIILGVSGNVQDSGGVLAFHSASGTATNEVVGNLSLASGANTISLITGGGGARSSALFSGGLAAAGNGTGLNLVTTASSGGNITITGATNANGILNPRIYFNGADFASVLGNNELGAATYATNGNTVSLASGNLIPYAINATGISAQGNANVNGGIKIGQNAVINVTAGRTLTINGTAAGINAAGGILVTGASNATIQGGSVSTNNTADLVIRVNGPSDVLNLNSTIGAGTTGGLTKNGLGTLVIRGANAQSGATNINEGTVQLSTGGRLSGNNQQLNLRTGATLDLNGNNTGNAISVFNGGGNVTNSLAGSTSILQVGNNNGGGTFSGIVQDGNGKIRVIKQATANQTWSGMSTYTGNTTINSSGVVSVATLGNIGTASGIGFGDVADNAGSLVITGTGGLNYIGTNSTSTDRLFTLNGNLTNFRIGNDSSTSAALIYSNPGAVVYGPSVLGTQTLTFEGSSTADNLFVPVINDVGGGNVTQVIKNGAGTWGLVGANTYTGNTTVLNGQLNAISGAGLPTSSGLILGSGTNNVVFQSSGNFTRDIVVQSSAGNNTVSWGTSVTSGTVGFAADGDKLTVALGDGAGGLANLSWGANGFGVGTGALVLNSATGVGEVDFKNNIDFGAATRTIQVNDNSNTATDFATISGNITGTASLIKSGGGILQLFGANDYTGNTTVTGGTLSVTSLGNSALPGTSSVGRTNAANTTGSALLLGNGGTTGAVLQYLGSGETSDRMIRLNTTTAGNQIHADGSGALVLTNLDNTLVAGNKTLNLRGTNTAGNTLTSDLTDGGGNSSLSITIDGAATWILTGNNTQVGTTTVSAGAFGIGSDTAAGAGTLSLQNGSTFAYGGNRTLSNPVVQTNNTTPAFIGDNSITLLGNYANQSSANNNGLTNNIVEGQSLTLGNYTVDSINATRNQTFNGTGSTIITGTVSTSTGFNPQIVVATTGNGSLTLAGPAASPTALNNGSMFINSGRLRLGANEQIPDSGVIAGNVTTNGLVIQPAGNATATFDLRGFSETVNSITATSAGSTIIDNSAAATDSTLTFGANNRDSTIGGATSNATNNYTIQNSGAGSTLNLTKAGAGNGTITSAVALNHTGATSVTGGTLTVLANVNGSTALNVSGNGMLIISGNITSPTTVSTVNVGEGTLSLLNGTADKLSNLTNLTLGSTGGNSTFLSLNAGDVTLGDQLNTDTLSLNAGGTLTTFAGNTIKFNITDNGLNPDSDYVLLDASAIGGGFYSTLSASDYLLGTAPGGFTGFSLSSNSTTNQIILHTGGLITGSSYFTGNVSTKWNESADNWSTDKAGNSTALSIPGQGTDVIFRADNANSTLITSTVVDTTLEQNFKINSLTFEPSTLLDGGITPTQILIAGGNTTVGAFLEVAPQQSTDGIRILSGGPSNVTISAPIRLGGNVTGQTWNVADASSNLTITSGLQGERDIVKTGDGKVVLSGAAVLTANATAIKFNAGNTMDVSVANGTLELTNSSALGTAGNNQARISIDGGAFYYNNPTSFTLGNNLTLNGGTLSAGGNNQTYGSQTIAVNANSTVNLRNNNDVALNATARTITLSGNLTGSGNISVTGSTTGVAAGNPVAGGLTLSGNNSGWSGTLNLNRGSITAPNVNSLGSNPNLTAQYGRITFTSNGTLSPSVVLNSLTLDAANGTLELGVDNSVNTANSTVLNLDVNGPVTLGSVANANNSLRLFTSTDGNSQINLNGGVVLGNNASISVSPGAAGRDAVIQTVGISETLAGSILTINDDIGINGLNNEWNQTNGRLQINAAGNYTGGTNLDSGTLIVGDDNALGSGRLRITGTSALQASSTRVMTNALELGTPGTAAGSAFTVSGNQSITLNGGTTVNAGGARTITNQILEGGTLTLAGNTYLSSNSTAGSLIIAGNASTLLSGDIADSNGFGATDGRLTITNSAVTTLLGNNSYSGLTTMNAAAGRLLLSGSNSSAGNTTLTNGILQLDNASNGGLASGVLTLTAGTVTPLNAARSLSNEILLTAVTFNGTQDLTLNGNLTNNLGSRTLTNNLSAGSTLTQVGGVNLSENSTIGRTLTIAGNGTTVVSGTIQNEAGGAGVAGGLSVTNTALTTLSGANTYSGLTTMNAAAGTLRLSGTNSSAGNTTLTTGKLEFDNAANGGIASGILTLTAGTIEPLNAARTLSNNTTLGGNINVNGTQDLSLTGTITNSQGNRVLTNNLVGGILTLGDISLSENATGRTLTVGGPGNTEINGAIVNLTGGGGGAGVLTKTGNGTLTLSNTGGNVTGTAGNTYSGGTNVNAGILLTTQSHVLPNSSTIVVNANTGANATLDLNGNDDTIGGLTFGGTGANSTAANRVETGVGTLTLGNTVTASATNNPTITPVLAGNVNLGAATRTFNVGNSNATIVDLDVQAVVSGNGVGITKTGVGVLQLSNTNTYTGTTTLGANSGVVLATANNALGTGAVNISYATGSTTGQLGLIGNITLGNSGFTTTGAGNDGAGTNGVIRSISGDNVITGNLSMTGGGGSSTYRADTGASLTVNGFVGSTANALRELTLVGGGNFTFGGTIQDSNGVVLGSNRTSILSSNTGTTTFSGNNTYTGATIVSSGSTLIAGSTTAFGVGSATTVNGTLRLGGNSNSIGSLAGEGVVENANGISATLTVGGSPSTSFAGLLQDGTGGGALSLSKTVGNTLTLTGNQTYTGSTSVTGGALVVGPSGSLATPTLSVGASGNFTSQNAAANTALVTTLAVTNDGIINLAASQTIASLSGTTGSAALNQVGTLTVTGGGSYDGAINGSGANLDVTGGSLALNGSNGYTGTTNVNGASLALGAAGSLATTDVTVTSTGSFSSSNSAANSAMATSASLLNDGIVSFGGNQTIATLNGTTNASTLTPTGTLTVSGGGSYSGAIVGAGGLTISGGNMTLTGTNANTYNGLTTVSGGTLLLNKTVGVNAIVGDGVSSKNDADVIINGGTLKLNANNQLDDSVYIRLESGTFNRNGKTETIYNFVNAGGTYSSGRGGSFTIIDPIWSGGTTDILSAESYGNLEISGGTNTIHGDEGFGLGAGSVTVGSGGLLFNGTLSPSLTISSDNTAAGSLILNGDVSVTVASGTATILQGNRLVDNGDGTWTNTGSLGSQLGTLDLGAATRTFTVGDGTAGVDLQVAVGVTNGGLSKTGLGTLELTGADSYDGGTTVSGGALIVNGDQSAANGAFVVTSAGTLAGTGTIGGATSIDGIHAVGSTLGGVTGIQTFTDTLTYNSGSTFEWDLSAYDSGAIAPTLQSGFGTGFDGVMGNGALSISSLASTKLTLGGGNNWSDLFWNLDRQWLVFDGFTGSDAFSNANISLAGGGGGGPTGTFTWVNVGGDVFLNYTSAVPEPASLGGAMVLLGSWFARRRTAKRKKTLA